MAATFGDFIAFVRKIAKSRHLPLPMEGLIVPDTWNPVNCTAHVLVGHTGSLFDSDTDQVIVLNPVRIVTNHVGDQGGPIGNERCIVFPYEDGHTYVAMLFSDQQDTPNVPAGEKHTYLRSLDVSLAMACFIKVQTDATRIGHQRKVVLQAPVINFGVEESSYDQGVVIQKLLQQGFDDLTQNVQQALNQGFQSCQPGSGVPPPTIAQTTAQGSRTSFSKE